MRILRGLCFECRAPADHDHHVVPRSKGGTRTVPLCSSCHAKAHDNHGLASTTSALVREGLARARAAGKRLGAPPCSVLIPGTVERIRAMRAAGLSLRVIADQLNAEGVEGGRGGKWWPRTVRAVLVAE